MRLTRFTALLLLLTGPLLGAQGPLVGRVVLAAVTDARNRPVVDVDADDFVVHEDGEPREVLSVRIADYPLVLLIDDASHATADFGAMRTALARFVTRVGDRPIAIITMAGSPVVLAGFEDQSGTLNALESLEPSAFPERRPFQALAEAARLIAENQLPFAAVVAITVASQTPADPEPRGLLTSFFDSRDILHVVTRAGQASPSALEAMTPDDVLRDVATRSGGRATVIYTNVSFQIALDQVADALAAELLVEYVAPSDAPVTADVRVGVAIPGTRVRGLGVFR